MTNAFANQRMGEQMAATVIAAIQGSQQARDALAECIPFYGLKCMDDAANALCEQGKYFEAGKKSSEFTTASITTAVGAGQALKASVGLFRVAKMAAKVKPRVQRVPASFGRAPEGMHYTDVFFEGNPKLEPIRSQLEVHHWVEQQVLTKPGYDGIVSRSEIDSLENLRGIRKGMVDPNTGKEFHRSTIRLKWNEFYRKYDVELKRPPTKQEFLDFRTKIDDLFGHMFVPPVR